MTKLLYGSVLLAIALLLPMCSEDEYQPDIKELDGTWKMESLDYSGTLSNTLYGQEQPFHSVDFVGTAFDVDLSISFSEFPPSYTTNGNYSILVTYDPQGQPYEKELTNQGFLETGRWVLDGDKVGVTTINGDVFEATIVSLDESKLVLQTENMEVTDAPSFRVTTEVDQMITFARQ